MAEIPNLELERDPSVGWIRPDYELEQQLVFPLSPLIFIIPPVSLARCSSPIGCDELRSSSVFLLSRTKKTSLIIDDLLSVW